MKMAVPANDNAHDEYYYELACTRTSTSTSVLVRSDRALSYDATCEHMQVEMSGVMH